VSQAEMRGVEPLTHGALRFDRNISMRRTAINFVRLAARPWLNCLPPGGVGPS
jgi:hypothetical protein